MKRIRKIRTICGGAGVMMLLMAPALLQREDMADGPLSVRVLRAALCRTVLCDPANGGVRYVPCM